MTETRPLPSLCSALNAVLSSRKTSRIRPAVLKRAPSQTPSRAQGVLQLSAKELQMMSQPGTIQTTPQDFNEYHELICPSNISCMRSPFRLVRPDALNSTHIAELLFWYDPRPEPSNLKARYRFSQGSLISYSNMVDKYGHGAQTVRPSEEEMAAR
ncbi:hypothetical protein BCR35DRAFT_41338 [Leucosporidium creatinivorum]|uniref:Uncharacterized protein n=1 Tax=Leucosporidium creatinivorum TaxID=106004 RepID=A0A1Y2C525_9BASI|nr:hypothetical protein BCR35DRAFT_41338 [Leucosporidium creatinivorum]